MWESSSQTTTAAEAYTPTVKFTIPKGVEVVDDSGRRLVPEVYGHWENEVLDGIPGHRPVVTFCSRCNNVAYAQTNYCPQCGARME